MVRFWVRAVAMVLVVACLGPVAQAKTQAQAQEQASGDRGARDIRSLNYTEKQQLLERIRKRLRRDFDTAKPFPGQVAYPPFDLKFRTEARNEVLVIELGPMNGPLLREVDMSELSAQLDGAIFDLLDELGISHPIFEHEFDGHSWYYYYPEERQKDRQHQLEYERRMQLKDTQSAIPPQGAKVAISAMHGYYWRVVDQVWKPIRVLRHIPQVCAPGTGGVIG